MLAPMLAGMFGGGGGGGGTSAPQGGDAVTIDTDQTVGGGGMSLGGLGLAGLGGLGGNSWIFMLLGVLVLALFLRGRRR